MDPPPAHVFHMERRVRVAEELPSNNDPSGYPPFHT